MKYIRVVKYFPGIKCHDEDERKEREEGRLEILMKCHGDAMSVIRSFRVSRFETTGTH